MVVSIEDVVAIVVSSAMVERAKYTARLKARNLANTWQTRDVVRKYTDLYPGDLAALAVEKLLVDHKLQVVNYDVYRVESHVDPNFERPGKWDLWVCRRFYVEVKSSLEKRFDITNLESVVNERRIMCYPRREVQIHVQVYYVLDDPSLCSRIEDDEFSSYEESDFLLDRLRPAYLMAWARREDLLGASPTELTGITTMERSRSYRDFHICDGEPIRSLAAFLSTCC